MKFTGTVNHEYYQRKADRWMGNVAHGKERTTWDVRGLSASVKEARENHPHGRRHVVIRTNSSDLLPLTYLNSKMNGKN